MKKMKDVDQYEDEINPYEVDKLSKIPSWLIIIILKYWAAAAAVFFTIIGGLDVGLDYSGDSDNIVEMINLSGEIIVMIALALSLLGNYAIKQVVLLAYNRRNDTYKWNIINGRGLLSFFLYFIYSYLISFILFFIIVFLGSKGLILNLFGGTDYGIEPFTYGFLFIIVDGIFVGLKDLGVYIYQRIRYKRQLLGA